MLMLDSSLCRWIQRCLYLRHADAPSECMVTVHRCQMAHMTDVCAEHNFHGVLSVWMLIRELWYFFDRKLGELNFLPCQSPWNSSGQSKVLLNPPGNNWQTGTHSPESRTLKLTEPMFPSPASLFMLGGRCCAPTGHLCRWLWANLSPWNLRSQELDRTSEGPWYSKRFCFLFEELHFYREGGCFKEMLSSLSSQDTSSSAQLVFPNCVA